MNEKLINQLNENKFFIGIMMIIVTIGGRFIISELTETQKKLIHNPNVRKLFIFCAFFMATRDIICAVILTIIFVLLISELFNDEENSISLLEGDDEGVEEDPQLQNDKKIQSMIDDLTEMKNNV